MAELSVTKHLQFEVSTTGSTLSLPDDYPGVKVDFPNGALTKSVPIGLQVYDSVPRSDESFCPGVILSIHPLRRKFHRPLSICLPVPETSAIEKYAVKLYTCISPKLSEECNWEDCTNRTAVTERNGIVSFESTVSASFWVIKVKPGEPEDMERMKSIFRQMLIGKEERKEDGIEYLIAAKEGDLDGVLNYIENKNVPINYRNYTGLGALAVCIRGGHNDIFRALLKLNADVHAKTKKNNTLLHIATLSQNYDVVVELVKLGVDVNAQSKEGFTAMYMASMNNSVKIAQVLLDNGANIHLTTTDGFSPLTVGLQQGSEDVVNLLLKEIQSSPTENLPEIVKIMRSTKKDHNNVKKELQTSLLSAVDEELQLDTQSVDEVTDHDVKSFLSSVMHASSVIIDRHLRNENIQSFLQKATSQRKVTSLHCACLKGHRYVAEKLLDKGHSVNVKTQCGFTPLYVAVRCGSADLVDLLLKYGADPKISDQNNILPMDLAKAMQCDDIVDILKSSSDATGAGASSVKSKQKKKEGCSVM